MYNGVVAYALRSESEIDISMMEIFNLTAIQGRKFGIIEQAVRQGRVGSAEI